MAHLYVLFEHAAGYSLFRSISGDDMESLLPQLQQSVLSAKMFGGMVELIAFQPFKTGRDALENMNHISEGILHPQLQSFLETSVPKTKKKKHPVILGVSEPKLAASIVEKLEMTCSTSGVIPELIRGIRTHFVELIKVFNDPSASDKAQLGLGHHYSRARVKFNVNRIDNMIIQSISLLDQLDKDINTFTMRVREWYSHHFPELIKIVPENALFIRCVRVVKNRKEMAEDVEDQLEEILNDPVKVQKIIEVANNSMGMDISGIDLENVYIFAERIISLTERRKEMMEYLRSKMHSVAPNLAALIGDVVGARLIAHAGSLINLAKYPASTVQILGAEKALFRALKTRGNTPKYGLIFHSKFIGKASKSNKGRISRYLANKCSVASRIDCFREIPTDKFGEKLRIQVEDRLKFYETGELPKKNVDVMTEAMAEAEEAETVILKKLKKAKKKAEKKQKSETLGDSTFLSSSAEFSFVSSHTEEEGESVPKKKKRKRNSEELEMFSHEQLLEESQVMDEDEEKPKKKKKKSLSAIENVDSSMEADIIANGDVNLSTKKKKKKKHSKPNALTEE